MPKILWTAGLIGVAAWTLLAGSLYGLVHVVFFLANASADATAASAVMPWLAALKTVGSAVLISIWFAVAAAILLATFLLARVFRPNSAGAAPVGPAPGRVPPSRDPAWMPGGPTIEGTLVRGPGEEARRPPAQS